MVTTKVVNVLKSEVLKMPIEEGKCLIDTMTQYVKDHLVVSCTYSHIPYIIKDIKWCEEKYQYCYKAEVVIDHPTVDPPSFRISVVLKSERNKYTNKDIVRHTEPMRLCWV